MVVLAIIMGFVGLMLLVSPLFLVGILHLMMSFSLLYWGFYLISKGETFSTPFWTREVRWDGGRIRLGGENGEDAPYHMREPLDQDRYDLSDRPLPAVSSSILVVVRIGGLSMVLAAINCGWLGLLVTGGTLRYYLTIPILVLAILGIYYGRGLIRFDQVKHPVRIASVVVIMMVANLLFLFMHDWQFGWIGIVSSVVSAIALTLSWKYL